MKNYFRLARYSLEKDVIEEFSDPFGIVIPANLLFYYKKSMAEFLRTSNRPFFVDPVTYLFAYPANLLKTKDFNYEIDNSGNYKVKKSFEKLVDAFDEDLIKLFKTLGALPSAYFDNPLTAQKFVSNCINFQKNLLIESIEPISRYESMLGTDTTQEQGVKPVFIVPPYFFFRNLADPWYAVNLRLSKLTKQFSPDDLVYSVISTDKDNLDEAFADKIIADFDTSDGFLLFISDLNESGESLNTLKNLMNFVNRIYINTNKPIINLYGSFFSMLLNFRGLDGVTSGLCILDHRDATAEFKGGRAAIRFYLPSTRAKLAEQDFSTFLQNFNTNLECDCLFCQRIAELRKTLGSRDYAAYIDRLFSDERGELMASAMEHYLHNRIKEARLITDKPLTEILAILVNNKTDASKYSPLINTGNFVEKIIIAFQ